MLALICLLSVLGLQSVVAVSDPGSYVYPDNFLATFSSTSTGGASGTFLYYLNQYGQGRYKWSVDVASTFAFSEAAVTAGCSFSDMAAQGMKYHFHTYWTDTTSDSSNVCGSATTGPENHYDPYLACSGSSQNAATLCPALNRTAADGYTYGCSASAYANGSYALCEAGDLSGKFGNMMGVLSADGTNLGK